MPLEQPEYNVAYQGAGFEIRRYAPRLVAETLIVDKKPKAATAGFRRLANYLLGENEGRRSGPATSLGEKVQLAVGVPYVQYSTDEGTVLQFPIGRRWTLDSTPLPKDPLVHIRALRHARVAAQRYSGMWSEARFRIQRELLERALNAADVPVVGGPQWARYDPPWMPWFARRNEIWFEIAPDWSPNA